MTFPSTTHRPRLLIEEWLPAQAIGVECMREENNPVAKPPTKYFHVWWARRPLAISRAAVLGSLLPAGFDRATFERLLGFGRSSEELVRTRELMDTGIRVPGGFGAGRAFSNAVNEEDAELAHRTMSNVWGDDVLVLDPMAGGGSIPLEAARLGLNAMANEYNPVACTVLEATVDYPFRFGPALAERVRRWAKEWERRAAERLAPFYPKERLALVHAYIHARTIPCPDTGYPTPLVPSWSLSRPRGRPHIVANPVRVNEETGDWTIEVKQVGRGAGMLRQPPPFTFRLSKGWSLFTRTEIPTDYAKVMAQQGRMGSVLYAVATKATGLEFRPAEPRDLAALEAAERELARLRPVWEREGIIPTEMVPLGDKTKELLDWGMTCWADLFSPRQLLAHGVLVEELRRLRREAIAAEGGELGEAVVHLLALALDKLADYNCHGSVWHSSRGVVAHRFSQHNYSFKSTFAELAPCASGNGLSWAVENTLKAYRELSKFWRYHAAEVTVRQGSATGFHEIDDRSVTAVVVDPPYSHNVQYSELADFFYVWLKRTQGHRRPAWFSSYLCEHDQEAVVNLSRYREEGGSAKEARALAGERYRALMTDTFREAHRVLRDDGVLTVMFTHKQQSAWADLFEALIAAGFTITATWPVQTESQHSLHQANKNAAQSTVVLVARKRAEHVGRHYYDAEMQQELRQAAREAAARFEAEGLTQVDQLVGAFGPAMAVYSRHAEVRTDTGERVRVEDAIQAAADAVVEWRVERLARRGLKGVDAESRFALLCWDVLGAQEFRFNEAMLLGRSAGMDVNALVGAGLVTKSGDKVRLLSARERRRDRPARTQAEQLAMLGTGRGSRNSRQVHPADEAFATAIDACHALALRYAEAGGGQAGLGAARGMALQHGWKADSACARLMEALVLAAPPAVRFPGKKGKPTAADRLPEFRAWHAMLEPLFGLEPPEWVEGVDLQPGLWDEDADIEEDEEESGEETDD